MLSDENSEKGDKAGEDEIKGEDKDQEKTRVEFENELKKEKKIKLEAKNGKIKVEVEDENEKEENSEIELEGELEIEDGTVSGKLKIKSEEESLLVIKNSVAARSIFPLSLELSSNELIVNTPSGVKRVAILPDLAVRNMILEGVVTNVAGFEEEGEVEQEATESAGVKGKVKGEIEISTDQDGRLVYEMQGERFEVFLGIFPVRVKKKIVVSAETGELLRVDQTLIQRIIDFLSFG